MSNPTFRLTDREVCNFCCKNILFGQTTILCNHCDLIFHARCATPDNFEQFRGKSYCRSCTMKNEIRRYNPFFSMFDDLNPDKFYDDEPPEFVESVEKLSKVLEDCKNYSCNKFNTMVSTNQNKENFTTCFINIDGAQTNFDSLVTELNRINHKFSIVAIAETNINSSEKDLYIYKSFYTACLRIILRYTNPKLKIKRRVQVSACIFITI